MKLVVEDVMTHREQLVSSTPETTLAELVWQFVTQGIRQTPVVDPDDRVIGMVTITDVLHAAYHRAGAAHAWRFELGPRELESRVEALRPHRELVTVRPEDTLQAASRRMLQARVHSLPVVDPSGVLVGLVTSFDVLEAVSAAGVGEQADFDRD